MNTDELFEQILSEIQSSKGIRTGDIPNLDLYMDQLTTFMDEGLREVCRHPETDKVLTKTMINNYSKNDLLPPPVRKRYSKDHIILLILIFYMKNLISIHDIGTLLKPLKEQFHISDTEPFTLSNIYKSVRQMAGSEADSTFADIRRAYGKARASFLDVEEEKKDRMQMFAFICMLAYDSYCKQYMIQKMLDAFAMEDERKRAEEKEAEKERRHDKHRNK